MDRRNAFTILIFTASRLVMNIMFRLPYAFLPVLARGMGVDVGIFSPALGARSLASASAPFLAALSDRRGRRFGMLLGLGIFLAGLMLVIALPAFPAFVVSLLLTSIGNAAFNPAMQAFIGDRIPYSVRSRAIGLTEFGWSLSILIGIPLMGLVIRRYGWSAPFPILLALGVLCFLAIVRLVPSDRGDFQQGHGLAEGFRIVFRSRGAVIVLLTAMLIAGANEALNLVFAVWIDVSFGLQIIALSAASIVIGFAELGGESLVALVTDRLGKLRSVLVGLLLNCLFVLILPILPQSLPAVLACLFFVYLTFEFSLVSLIPITSEVLPEARAMLLAFTTTFFFLGRTIMALVALPLFSAAGILGIAVITVVVNGCAVAFLLLFRRQPESRLESHA